jgi:hypothetical protein
MDRIESQNEEDRNIAKRILIWIANAKRPLSVAELREAIAIEPSTKTQKHLIEMVFLPRYLPFCLYWVGCYQPCRW